MTSPWVNDSNAVLLTDLYELTMLQSYFHEAVNETAAFDLFVRRLPASRNYLVVCGLEHALHYLETLSFSPEAIEYLGSLKRFSKEFLNSLTEFKFSGDVYAVPEGTVMFPNEPIIEIIAPLPQAQLVETFLMNQIQIGTLAASKAARVVHAAGGRPVFDFGVRRMHGADAGIKAPRAFYIAGVAGTSNVLAGQLYGIPVAGTMAHSFIQAFENELDAFRRFVQQFPDAILLVDTYDTSGGVRNVIQLAREMGPQFRVSGIRLDSGDIGQLAMESRKLLDAAGLTQVRIFASSSLDEYAIEELLSAGAPIDGFGVGGRMGVSDDAPLLDTAYKLVEYAGQGRMKLSADKVSLPGRKQVFRETDGETFSGDVIGLAGEKVSGKPLLVKVMEGGRRTQEPETLEQMRARCRSEIENLPPALRALGPSKESYPIGLSQGLRELRAHTLDLIEEDES